jgi:hypothetical protein
MGEDRSRIRCNPQIFAKLRSFALNILRKNKVENVSGELAMVVPQGVPLGCSVFRGKD